MMVLAIATAGLNRRWGMVPPLGKFLSPFEGAWQSIEQPLHKPGVYPLKGRDGEIRIELDEDLIPHISASSERDLFFAQGYVIACHRLWQLDFQTRAAAGRLSEVIGEKTLEMDRFQRRFGIPEAARRSTALMLKDTETRTILFAYTEGINEALAAWSKRKEPLEFKLLDYLPESWKVENSALLLKQMAYTLSGRSDDLAMNRALERYGKSVMDQLFPAYRYDEEPIIPSGTRFGFRPLQVPEVPLSLGWTDTTDDKIPANKLPVLEDDNGIGSNNWAISGSKTKSGFPILANDPHLAMRMPSTWYMAELECPGYHVMGAVIPGAPGIISGFNKNFAWGITNGYPDVCDWYEVTFNDKSCSHYWMQGNWLPSRKVQEEIVVRGAENVVDEVIWTENGPVVYRKGEKPFQAYVPPGCVLRWTGHDAGNELKAFLHLGKSSRIDDVPAALESYSGPAQNFAVADAAGNIAMYAQHGKIPLRWKEQGKFLLQAGPMEHAWQGWIPKEHLPTEKNPVRGFVSSANQVPADTSYPYYLNWNYYSLERARRINQVLAQPEKFDLLSIQKLQNDNLNLFAQKVLPEMLRQLALNKDPIFQQLATWNFRNDPAEIAPGIFDTWFRCWMELVWSDDFEEGFRYPDKQVTWQIFLEKDNSSWFDIRNTKQQETGSFLLKQAFFRAKDTLTTRYGSFSKTNSAWQWANVKATRLEHMARIPGLGVYRLNIGGGKDVVNATSSQVGQSWKMLVQLGPSPEALGIYPGGQSGNPASEFYNNFTERWRTGQYRQLKFRH
jgi:penicillin amidase